MRAALLVASAVILGGVCCAAEPLLSPRPIETFSDTSNAVNQLPFGAAPCGRPEFPPPQPCKHGSYLRYRANYFGYGSFDYRRVFNYPWPAGDGCCGAGPIVAPRPAAHELQPTPASEIPQGATRSRVRR